MERKFLPLLFVIAWFMTVCINSCFHEERIGDHVINYAITNKSWTNGYGKAMPANICYYTYDYGWRATEDSCSKYNIGDTVIHKK